MTRILRNVLSVVLVFCWSISAHAETPRSVSFELRTGPILSEIDNEFSDSGLTPYDDIFSSDLMWAFGGYLDYQFYQGVGSLALGMGLQYGSVSGFAKRADGTATEESTTMHLLPLSVGLTYRFDYLAQKFKIPLVPYVKVGVTCAIWWVTNDKGEVANTYAGTGEEALGWSNTFGFYGGGGIQFLLDVLSPRMAAAMDSEVGVNNSYLFVEYLRHELNDFYSDTSINLSGHGISFGLIFEF